MKMKPSTFKKIYLSDSFSVITKINNKFHIFATHEKPVKFKNPIPPTRRPTHRPTRRSTHHRHTTDTSANTLLTRRPTHYRRVGRHTTDTLVETLPTRWFKYLLSLHYAKYLRTFRYSPSLILSLGTKLRLVYFHGLP